MIKIIMSLDRATIDSLNFDSFNRSRCAIWAVIWAVIRIYSLNIEIY